MRNDPRRSWQPLRRLTRCERTHWTGTNGTPWEHGKHNFAAGTLTTTVKGTDMQGKPVDGTNLYDKQ